jgi:hypothetical protein
MLHAHPFHPTLFPYSNSICWWAQTMKLLIMHFSPCSCYFFPLKATYSPQHFVENVSKGRHMSTVTPCHSGRTSSQQMLSHAPWMLLQGLSTRLGRCFPMTPAHVWSVCATMRWRSHAAPRTVPRMTTTGPATVWTCSMWIRSKTSPGNERAATSHFGLWHRVMI